MKLNYIVIPAITIVTATIGSLITSSAINSGWYDAINKPAWTPAGSIIGIVWTIIFILATIAALLWFNQAKRDNNFRLIIGLFVANAFLNALWSYLFFGAHRLGPAVVGSALLGLTVVALIAYLRKASPTAAWLLVPYALWVTFATYLTHAVWTLNR